MNTNNAENGVVVSAHYDYRSGKSRGCSALHCLGEGIDISLTMHLVDWAQWVPENTDEQAEVLTAYAALPAKASECIECGDCMKR